jgi:hypothetical protein
MGIKDLNKSLVAVNAVINKKSNKNLLKKFIPLFCNKTKGISGFVCHVDLSLVLYRFLYSFDNMEDVYRNIKKRILELKSNNNEILFYLEPYKNKRKEETHKEREISQNKTKLHLKNDIEKEIELFNNFKLDDQIEINESLLGAIGFYTSEEKKTTFEDYIKNIQVINEEKDMYIKKKNVEQETELFDHGFSIPEEDLEFIKEDEKKEYNIIRDKKQLFHFFLYQNSMSNHKKYIITRLLDENVIKREELIESAFFDGEINIISEIKNRYVGKKNLIISIDQDCILFALLHHPTKYIYLKNNISIEPDDLNIIKNNYLTKNIALLTAFFNKTDYFKGISNCGITVTRLKKYLSGNVVFTHKLDFEEVISSYLQWFIKSQKNIILSETNTLSLVHEYINNFQLYISLDPNFYSNNKCFKKLEISDLHNYFLDKEQMIPYINEENEEIIYQKYN